MTVATNPIKNLTRRERRTLIAALVIVPFFYPFLLVWSAHSSLDEIYEKAEDLPAQFRRVAIPDGECHSGLAVLKDAAHAAILRCVGALPDGSKDPLNARHMLEDMEFLPVFGRGLVLWGQVGKICRIPRAVWKRPAQECPHAGQKLRKAASDLEAAIASYEQTRTLMQVLLYVWLIAEVFGWIVVIYFARRFWRERAAAKASSPSGR